MHSESATDACERENTFPMSPSAVTAGEARGVGAEDVSSSSDEDIAMVGFGSGGGAMMTGNA